MQDSWVCQQEYEGHLTQKHPALGDDGGRGEQKVWWNKYGDDFREKSQFSEGVMKVSSRRSSKRYCSRPTVLT